MTAERISGARPAGFAPGYCCRIAAIGIAYVVAPTHTPLRWVVARTYQHKAEHTSDILRIALYGEFFVAEAS